MELEEALNDLEPTFDHAQQSLQASAVGLQQAQAEMQHLQQSWDENSQQVNDAQQNASVERAKLEQLDSQIGRAQSRSERIQAELGQSDVNPLQEKFELLQKELQAHRSELDELESNDVDVDVLAEHVKRASELIELCRDRIGNAKLRIEEVVAQIDAD